MQKRGHSERQIEVKNKEESYMSYMQKSYMYIEQQQKTDTHTNWQANIQLSSDLQKEEKKQMYIEVSNKDK